MCPVSAALASIFHKSRRVSASRPAHLLKEQGGRSKLNPFQGQPHRKPTTPTPKHPTFDGARFLDSVFWFLVSVFWFLVSGWGLGVGGWGVGVQGLGCGLWVWSARPLPAPRRFECSPTTRSPKWTKSGHQLSRFPLGELGNRSKWLKIPPTRIRDLVNLRPPPASRRFECSPCVSAPPSRPAFGFWL